MPKSRIPAWFAAALLALFTLAVYWPAMRCDFINYDDPDYVTSNVHVQKGLSLAGVKWAFSSTVASNWHPLTMLSHMLDCQLYGLKPWGHHLTSVLLHALNTVLVFVWLRKITGATWRSLFVAALFGWHPLRVESVAWVAERKDVLSSCLGLLSLIFYARQVEELKSGDQKWKISRGLSLIFLALGLMSKAMLVTWPFVMLLLDYWPLNRFTIDDFRFTNQRSFASLITRHSSLLLEKIPFFALTVAASVVTFVVQKHAGAMVEEEVIPLAARGENALISYGRYLGKMFWPEDFAVLYPHPGYWPSWAVTLAGISLAGISLLFWTKRRSQPFLLMGWLWYCGTLVPVIGLVQVGDQAMADRYTYIPMLGVLILSVWGAYELARRRHYLLIPLSAVGAAAILFCPGLTWRQLGYWHDSETLFRHTIKVTANNCYAYNNLGAALEVKGRFDEAIDEFQKALSLHPDYADAHNNLGASLDAEGRAAEAIPHYQQALRFKGDSAYTRHLLGVDLIRVGRADEAILQLREGLRLSPDDASIHNDLGNALDARGQTDDAMKEYEEAVHLDSKLAEAHGNLGAILGRKGDLDGAINQLQEAVRGESDDPIIYYNLGMALVQKGRTKEAIVQLQEALRLKPDFAEAIAQLTNALETINAPPTP